MLTLGSCSQASYTDTITSATYQAIDEGDCTTAISVAASAYNSASSNNEIRMAYAQAYACAAGVDLLTLTYNISQKINSSGAASIWGFLASNFPSTTTPTDDKIPQKAIASLEALFAILEPNTLVSSAYSVNASTYNPMSVYADDRTTDANTLALFVTLPLIGSLLYRYGDINSKDERTVDLPWANTSFASISSTPWSTSGTIASDGCALAAGVLNLYDQINIIVDEASSSTASAFFSIQTILTEGLDAGCELACSLCASAGACTSCPQLLRYPGSCTNSNTDPNTCAAIGVITFVNASWVEGTLP
jgi:hypothetical protein